MKDNCKLMKYALVPLCDLNGLRLNSTDKLVMGMIMSLTRKTKECTASNEFLSRQIELSKRMISKTLTNLKNKNLIFIKTENHQRKIYSNIVWNNTSIDVDE